MWPQGGAGRGSFGPTSPGWGNLPPQVQEWMTANPNWMQMLGGRRPHQGWMRPPGVAGPTLSGRQPLPVAPPPYKAVGRSPGGDPLVPNTGQVGTPVSMPGGSPGGLLASLFDPAQHAGLKYAGMSNAGNAGQAWTPPSVAGTTNQILAAPITPGEGGMIPQGLGTPVNVRAARLAGAAAQPAQDAALQAAGVGTFQDDMWAKVLASMQR
jgi:hypothetical protein